MKKIIFGITGLTLGGAERVLVDLCNQLVNKFDITIFTIYSKGELEKELNKKIHVVSLYDKKYNELSKKEKFIIPLSVFFNRRKIYKEYIKDKKYSAQIAFLEGPITRIFSLGKIKKGIEHPKKIAWIHNDISKVFGRSIKSKIKRIMDRNNYEKYETLVFVSNDNKDKFNKVYDDILLPKEFVVKNYINGDRIIELSKEKHETIFSKDEINIVQVSRLVEQKAIDRMIKVHANLVKRGIKHHIYIIGDGPLKNNLEKMIKEYKVEDTFTLLGAKENPYTYVKEADYVCLFSEFEGYGMVLEEAKILNKYILITHTAAIEALVDYKDYCRVVENSEKGIENAITFAVKNKDKVLKENHQYNYTNSRILDKIEQIINS